ncbi:MAG: rod shape-determining protein RodA, partial [Firmicutes bacterium]|nr:rod shape-determining protein RodA [Bacillota bacterium]
MAAREGRERRGFDGWLVACALLLYGVGLVIIYSTSQPSAPPQDPLYFVKHQLLYGAVGAVAFLLAYAIDYRIWLRYAWWLYGFGLLFLAVVLVHGHSALGAQRWIQLGPFQLQPSEFAKLIFILAAAAYLTRQSGRLRRLRDLAAPLVLTLVYFALVFKQPDLGTGLIFFLILLGMLWMADVPGRNLLIVYGGGLGIAVLAIWAHLTLHTPLPFVHRYQLDRLLIFLHPQSDPQGAGWNIIQSRIALGSGGIFGLGLMAGPETQLSFLPEPFTDFIFASLAEQLGYVGAGAVLILFLVLLWRALVAAGEAADVYGTLVAAGVAAMIAAQVLMNAGMAMGIMPVVGVPLPLLSAGGSSLITTAAALGLVANVGKRRPTAAAVRRNVERVPPVLPRPERRPAAA